MKKGLVFAGVFALAFVFLFSAAFAQQAKKEEPKKGGPKDITVTGEVVDIACFIKMGASGSGHKQCATDCAKAGIPLAIATEKGEIYLPTAKEDMKGANDILLPFVAEKVMVTGKLFEKGGQRLLAINTVEKAK